MKIVAPYNIMTEKYMGNWVYTFRNDDYDKNNNKQRRYSKIKYINK